MKIQNTQFSVCLLILLFGLGLCGCNDSAPPTGNPDEDTEVIHQDYLLTGDETWVAEKTYIVRGTLEIPSDVTLQILPGTTVKFGRDARIKVRGVLKVGTPVSEGKLGEKVFMTSDTTGLQPGDWVGILFDHTHGAESFLRGAVIEYATVAVDIRTSSPTVVDCTLRANETAVALDGSNAIIQHNDILNNDIGISTIGRQTRPRIQKNNITRNKTGIICENVQSIIVENNLNGNVHALRLQVKFNLTISNNWWGTTVVEEIDKAILDAGDPEFVNKQLGTVHYQPIAAASFADAGPRE